MSNAELDAKIEQYRNATEEYGNILLKAQAYLSEILSPEQMEKIEQFQKELDGATKRAGDLGKDVFLTTQALHKDNPDQQVIKGITSGISSTEIADNTPYDDAAIYRDWKDQLPVNCIKINKTELAKFPVPGLDILKYKTGKTKLSATVETKDKACKTIGKKIEWMCEIHRIPHPDDMSNPDVVRELYVNWSRDLRNAQY